MPLPTPHQAPFFWSGLLLCLGAALWPTLLPQPEPVLVGAAILAMMALFARASRVASLALAGACLLLGLALPGAPPENIPLPATVHGVVTEHRGAELRLDGDDGQRYALRGVYPPPPLGSAMIARIGPPRREPLLPGAPDARPTLLRAGLRSAQILGWEPLGPPLAPPTADRFDLAEHGGLLRAMINGDRRGLPEEEATLLRRTGVYHIVSISGLHIAVVAGALTLLCRILLLPLALVGAPRLARLLGCLGALAVAIAYTQAVGAPVPAVRALWMVALAGLAAALDRSVHPLQFLGGALSAVVLADPGQVGELSFQLSFGAVAGMMMLPHALLRWLPPDLPAPLPFLAASLGATVGATLGTLPVMALHFQQLPPLGFLTNLITLPLLGSTAVVAGLLAWITPGPVGLLALAVADAAAALNLALLRLVDVDPWTPAVGLGGAALLTLSALTLRRYPLSALLAALALLPLPEWTERHQLRVTFLPIGQGDASLLALPDGQRWLIDGGPGGDELLAYLRREGVRRLDRVYLSHPHPDHLAGLLPVFEFLTVDALWAPRPPEAGEADYLRLLQLAILQGTDLVLHPDDPLVVHPRGWQGRGKARVNDESLVLQVWHGRHRFLFTGDIEKAAEAALAPRIGKATVVKVPHHGSHSSSTPDFVRALQADVAVIPCGPDNRYRHPRPQTVHAWAASALYRTDTDGAIEITSDGQRLSIRRFTPYGDWEPVDRRPARPSALRGISLRHLLPQLQRPAPNLPRAGDFAR